MPTDPVKLDQKEEGGAALMTVLWMLLLLSLMASSLMKTTRSEIDLNAVLAGRAKAEALANAGIALAILNLTDSRPARRWNLSTSERAVSFGGGQLGISFEDEFGKIDLNRADEALLAQLFSSVTESPDAAVALAGAVADWRDPDQLRRLNGAEAKEYELSDVQYGPSNGPFEALDELTYVLGFTSDIVKCLRPALTVFSGRGSPDLRTAPPQVAAALGSAVGTRNGVGRSQLSGGAGLAPTALAGRALTIRSSAIVGENFGFVREAVVRVTQNRSKPFWVHSWAEASPLGNSAADSCGADPHLDATLQFQIVRSFLN